MAFALRQSTASQEVPLGQFIDTAGAGTTPTIANTDIKVWKTGATTLANKNSGGATSISNSVQYCVLDATDTDTLGPLVLYIFVSGSLPVKQECVVLSAANYDAAITPATALLTVNATQFAGQTITAAAGVTLPASVASPTNITAGTITTVTNLTNAAGAGDFTATMKTSIGTAVAASAVASVTGAVGSVTGAVGSVTGNVGNVLALANNSITAAAIAADAGVEIATAVLTAAAADPIASDIQEINGTEVIGNGDGAPWGPA